MSLASLIGGRVYNTIRGVVERLIQRNPGARVTDIDRAAAERVIGSISNLDPGDEDIIRGWARDARRSSSAAERLNTHGDRPTRNAIPANPNVPNDPRGDIRYSVVVEITDVDTNESVRAYLEIFSDRSLSGGEVHEAAREAAMALSFGRNYRNTVQSFGQPVVTDVVVVGAERRAA